MISFIKAAAREIDHVVWPTDAETRKYFSIVTIMIAISIVILFIFGTLVSKGMFAIREITPHDVSTAVSNAQIEDIAAKIKKTTPAVTQSGAITASGSTSASGSTIVSGSAKPTTP